uniref:Uncharacterized protein n=1 Tax=Arundo donax TaxID=35708 RepID=A0A0A9A844_ARUDO
MFKHAIFVDLKRNYYKRPNISKNRL